MGEKEGRKPVSCGNKKRSVVILSMEDLRVTAAIFIPSDEIQLIAIRSQGCGGQNVNKVATAIHLRFAINDSSLPELLKQRLLNCNDQRISKDGCVVIKSQQFSSQERNRKHALQLLQSLVQGEMTIPKQRKKTRPSRGSMEKRIQQKKLRSRAKELRQRVRD